MDKNFKLIPQNVGSVDGMQFVVNDSKVTGCNVGWTLNYGKMSLPVQDNIWPDLTEQQKELIQNIYDKLMSLGQEIVTESQ